MVTREADRDFSCYIKHPDRSFWEAARFRDPISEGTNQLSKVVTEANRCGCWANTAEIEEAWNDRTLCEPEDEINRMPIFYNTRTPADSFRTGGRASSPRTPRRR